MSDLNLLEEPQDPWLLQTILDASSDCIKVLDLDARLMSMNAGGMVVMEIEDFQSCRNLLWPDFWAGEDRLQVEAGLEAARAGHTFTFEGQAYTFAGTSKWWDVRISPLRNPAGKITNLLAISRDITQKKVTEQQLRERNAEVTAYQLAALEYQVNENERALQAFVQFTTTVASSTDLSVLARAAAHTVRDVIHDALGGFYLVQGDRAYPVFLSDNTPPHLVAARQLGISLNTPAVFRALQQSGMVFADSATTQEYSHGHANALGLQFYFQDSQPFALFATATQQPGWTDQERAVIESVGQGLGLALERLEAAEQMQRQRDEAASRARALEAFAVLSRDLAGETDRYVLIRQAQEIMLSLLTPGYALYWEKGNDRWKLKSQVGDIGDPALQRLVDEHGLPFDTPALYSTWLIGEPNYQDNYAQGADTPAEMIRHVNAATAFRVEMHGQPLGMLAIGLFDQRHWTPIDKAVLETAIYSLGLLLERADQTQQLEERTASLDAFVAFTEAAGAEDDALSLAWHAVRVVQANFPQVSIAYYELEGGLWVGKVWSSEVTEEVVAQIRTGIPVEALNFAQAREERTAVFADGWDAAGNQLSEAGMYGAAAFLPLFTDGDARSMFAVGKLVGLIWTVREQTILRAVQRSLQLALERAEQAQQSMRQKDALELVNLNLQASNEELEAFTYSVSHDLRTPVRHVMAFAELAEKALEKTPNERVQHHLSVVKQAATRMTDLIDGMLVLSRSGRQELHLQPVNLNVLVTQARRDAAAEFGTHPVHWQIGELPTVQGDAHLLQQVITNLLSNAVKYSAKREVSEVRVWVREEGSEWRVSVQDNGIGFAPGYAHKLFGIFQRLHSEREFKGTGVGLATVKRIVQKHGGRVFAESDGEHGATFGFTLPS